VRDPFGWVLPQAPKRRQKEAEHNVDGLETKPSFYEMVKAALLANKVHYLRGMSLHSICKYAAAHWPVDLNTYRRLTRLAVNRAVENGNLELVEGPGAARYCLAPAQRPNNNGNAKKRKAAEPEANKVPKKRKAAESVPDTNAKKRKTDAPGCRYHTGLERVASEAEHQAQAAWEANPERKKVRPIGLVVCAGCETRRLSHATWSLENYELYFKPAFERACKEAGGEAQRYKWTWIDTGSLF
jgi:hypothetical protein